MGVLSAGEKIVRYNKRSRAGVHGDITPSSRGTFLEVSLTIATFQTK